MEIRLNTDEMNEAIEEWVALHEGLRVKIAAVDDYGDDYATITLRPLQSKPKKT